MLKYKAMIEKLNVEQKLMLAATLRSFSTPWAEQAGLPSVRVSDPERVNAESGRPLPSLSALANSWNVGLMRDAARETARLARERSVDLLVTPRMGVACNPFCGGISEDPCLAGTFAEAYAVGALAGGVMPCLSGFSLEDADIAALDRECDSRALFEYVLAPLRALRNEGRALAFSFESKSGSYADVNSSVVGSFLRERAGGDGFVIADRVEKGRDAECLTAGNILLDGDADVLKAATESGVDMFGPDELDAAVDRAVSLAMACRAAQTAAIGRSAEDRIAEDGAASDHDFSLRATEESIVLLKNDGILPLKQNCRVAVIGHPDGMSESEFCSAIAEFGSYGAVGSAPGYLLGTVRSDREIPYACKLAAKADAVILFLRQDSPAERAEPENMQTFPAERAEPEHPSVRAKLPANRLALLDALVRVNPNVIAVLPSGEPADLAFDRKVSALLIAETKCARGAEALLRVISGATSPSGKLASTCYCDTDARFAALARERNAGKNRVGTFLGYRAYDIAGEHPKYPFGFGLSYTSFRYSDLEVEDGNAIFTLRNAGKTDGCEVVQLYVGKSDSALVRPQKELKAFQKIFLHAGESIQLSFRIDPEALAVYSDGAFVVENGLYRISFGSSVTDVRLETDVLVKGGAIVPDGQNVADYVHSISNILTGNFTLEPVKRMHLRPRKKTWKLGLLFLIIALSCEAIIALLGSLQVFQSYLANDISVALFIFVFPALLIAGVILMIVGRRKQSRWGSQLETLSDGCLSVQDGIVPEQPLERLFEETFAEEDAKLPEAGTDERDEALKYCDASVNFPDVCGQFAAFASDRGISVGVRGIQKLMAAFCTSRLIVIESASSPMLPKFFEVVSDFFESRTHHYEFPKIDGSDGFDSEAAKKIGAFARANAEKAFQDAQSLRRVVQVAAWSNASAEAISAVAEPFGSYFEHPGRAAESNGADGKASPVRSPNVWFVFAWNGKAGIGSKIPAQACLIDLELEETAEREEKTPVRTLNYYQLAALARAGRSDFCLDEETCWKRLDQLERYVGERRKYRIDHRTRIRMEAFSSVLLACGAEPAEALDCAAACVLLPSMSSVRGEIGGKAVEDFVRAIENIFGAEHASECKKVLTEFAAAAV